MVDRIVTSSPKIESIIEPVLWDDGSCIFSIADIQQHVLKAKSSQNTADNPSYSQAIHSSDVDKWWEAMETELNTLEVNLKAWKLMCFKTWMRFLPCMWAFHLKRFLQPGQEVQSSCVCV
ncbi:hypothetical protein ACHAW6_015644 [Cyclotella cf. meneghiniana]